MKSLQSVLDLIRLGVYMASIDLKDDKTTKPTWHFCNRTILKFVCMPTECGSTMRIFTKSVKNTILPLRKKVSWLYVYDANLQISDYEDWFSNVLNTIEILQPFGFTINRSTQTNPKPYQHNALGFIFNSDQMTITLTLEKKGKNLNLFQDRRCSYNKISIKTYKKFSSIFSRTHNEVILQ